MKPAAKSILPTTNFKFFSRTELAATQRTDSLPKPLSNFSARTSLTLHVSASCSSFSALLFARMSCNCKAATLSWTALSSDFFAASLLSASWKLASAPANFSFLGSIERATLAYTSIALTHRQRDIAAFDTFFTVSGTKSSRFTYLCSLPVSFMLPARESLSYSRRFWRKADSFMSFLASSQVSFFPISRQTAQSTTSTSAGGFAKDFTSWMSFLSKASKDLMAE
mmetsp:Transcript_128623/g.222764  ORF Transcript_128623/g.222764 Transcript_128623/m.222764 type:complete len:225 (+) Transcript_128623:302-976(+)